MADSADVAPGDTHRLREWFLLDGNRLLIAAAILLSLFVALQFVPVATPDGTLPNAGLTRLFSAFIGGNLTLITVVLSINQLVLSRELRTPNELNDEIDAAVDYRDDVSISGKRDARPEAPGLFLEHVLARLADAVDRLDGAVETVDDTDVRHEAEGIVHTLDAEVRTMLGLLEERDVALFTALATILRYNFAAEYNGCRRLQRAQAGDQRKEFVGALAMIQQRIEDLEVARHYVKTIYVQIELAKLSRLLLYVGVVALSTAAIALTAVAADPTIHPMAVRVAITLGFVPFAVLFAYILRVATVAQRTSTFVPFGSTE